MNRLRMLALGPASLALVAALLAGCAQQQPVIRLDAPFDEAQAKQMLLPGTNVIKGSALMRQAGGGVVTCAGMEVHLIPATDYAKRRMAAIYGYDNFSNRGAKFEPENQAYLNAAKVARCNAQGFFAYEAVADGEFFVVTTVVWKVGYALQGGVLMERVAVAGGQAKEITLAR